MFFKPLVIEGSFGGRVIKVIKTESFRKLSNFNFQRTKTLDQNSKQGLQVWLLLICNNTKENFLREPKKINVKFHKMTSDNELFRILPVFSQFFYNMKTHIYSFTKHDLSCLVTTKKIKLLHSLVCLQCITGEFNDFCLLQSNWPAWCLYQEFGKSTGCNWVLQPEQP